MYTAFVGEEIIICKKYHTLKCHDICINNVKPDATFEIIGMCSCISPLYVYIKCHCSGNWTSFRHFYGQRGFFGKGGTACCITHEC